MIRSEFSGVKVGDHIYGILREFLNYFLIANEEFNIFRYDRVYP